MSWNNGYVSDIEYPPGFFYEQSPAHLNLACLLNGYEPVALDRPFTYCELGCGPGLTANILAASNPHGRFYAVDFNPAHVAGGEEMAAAAGLENLTMLENSFAELAVGMVDLPQFDFVSMYGVYGWVNAENRRHVVNFLKRYVKPGGIVHLNYNTQPGWAAVQPLHRLILEMTGASVGPLAHRFEQARQRIMQLKDLQARYLTENDSPNMQHRLESIQDDEVGYLIHEYMNQGWEPLYHADVASQVGQAGLGYAGSADLLKAFPRFYLTPQQQELFARTPVEQRETLADYLRNTSFRDDIYVRDAKRLSPEQQGDWDQRIGLALTMPRALTKHKIRLVTGELIDREDLFVPVLDALAEAPRTLAELRALPALANEPKETVHQMAALLVAGGQVSAYQPGPGVENDAARQMNRTIAFSSHYNNANQVLASPVAGNGISTSRPARLVYRLLCEHGEGLGADEMVERVWELMGTDGRTTEESRDREALTTRVHTILEKLVPVWRQLKVL